MCHESSGSALTETIGIGKGSVLLEDLYKRGSLIIVAGQNPGHEPSADALRPGEGEGGRRADHLGEPAAGGGPEKFKNPQTPKGLTKGASLTDLFLQIRARRRPGPLPPPGTSWSSRRGATDDAFIAETHLMASRSSPLPRGRRLGRDADGDRPVPRRHRADPGDGARLQAHRRVLGDGPHPAQALGCRHDPQVVNFLLLRAKHRPLGRGRLPGARPLERAGATAPWASSSAPAPAFLDALEKWSSGFVPPARARLSTSSAPSARCATARRRSSFAMGGNFVAASPTPRSPRRPCAGPASPSTCRRS